MMSRTFWPASLDDLLGQPVVPQCPDCPWSAVCPSDVQAGVAVELKRGRLAVADCIWFVRFRVLYRRETGREAPEHFSPDDLAYTLAERRGVRSESAERERVG